MKVTAKVTEIHQNYGVLRLTFTPEDSLEFTLNRYTTDIEVPRIVAETIKNGERTLVKN